MILFRRCRHQGETHRVVSGRGLVVHGREGYLVPGIDMVAQGFVVLRIQLLARGNPLRLGVEDVPQDLHVLVVASRLADRLLILGSPLLQQQPKP